MEQKTEREKNTILTLLTSIKDVLSEIDNFTIIV